LSFNANYSESEHVVNIDWSTATQINNRLFTIEKTQDGITWEKVDSIAGADNSTTVLSYSTIDPHPFSGVSYYRLKQTDFDGNYTYPSQEVLVSVSDIQLKGVTIIPNPANKNAIIEFYSTSAGIASLKIYNSLGALIASNDLNANKGITDYPINLSGYSNGLYFIVIAGNNVNFSGKLLVNQN
jgi:hypothetical protein